MKYKAIYSSYIGTSTRNSAHKGSTNYRSTGRLEYRSDHGTIHISKKYDRSHNDVLWSRTCVYGLLADLFARGELPSVVAGVSVLAY